MVAAMVLMPSAAKAENWVMLGPTFLTGTQYADKDSASRKGELATLNVKHIGGYSSTLVIDCVRKTYHATAYGTWGSEERPIKKDQKAMFDMACGKSWWPF